jgi:hypothetical protein
MNTRSQLAKAQAKMEQLISERDHFKSVESRLTAENESLYREMRSQSLISTSLQAIQVTFRLLEVYTMVISW